MAHNWKKQVGVDDMVLLQKISEAAIVDNLKKRLMDDCIYTYIGPVLISVNPFKSLPIYTDKEVNIYQGSAAYENPPHIYALTDEMYRNMLIEMENQCVIISGESGAGKTVAAKYIMAYIARVSGGGDTVQRVKDIILESNPLLEAFGNAKTLRNNNSSRFGKYVEIQFSRSGQPIGGKISNFLLEKSRVVGRNQQERSFHIFYQIHAGASAKEKESLGLTTPDHMWYLSMSSAYKVDGTDDSKDYKEVMHAMSVMGLSQFDQNSVLELVAAVLHLGNIQFVENGNYAAVADPRFLEFPAYLLGINSDALHTKLISRTMNTSRELVHVTLNIEQATLTRDALAKAIYARLFDFLVDTINNAMAETKQVINIGILDIYGFEIFDRNGFEQFCINYVNEKLQQIFIELTLKAEQEEYVQEGIKWTPIDYFNNKIVCDLIESKSPPGIISVVDDVCATMHAKTDGADEMMLQKLGGAVGSKEYYQAAGSGFIIQHYAGRVSYEANGFCERNRDVLFSDLIELMQSSSKPFYVSLFPEVISGAAATRPTTVGTKIRLQANKLVDTLMKCTPHYIRCIKPNDTKQPRDFEDSRVKHQVEYLGLKENIRVRRAGFAYRRPFDKFLKRYAILSPQTWPKWTGDVRKGIDFIMQSVNMEKDQYQMGKSKIFVKSPEALFLLEETRDRKFDGHARVIQKAFRKWNAIKHHIRMRAEAAQLVSRKERRRYSINRSFHGDYIKVDANPALRALLHDKRERVEFADYANKYDRRGKATRRELILSAKYLYLIHREKQKDGPNKGKFVPAIYRKIPLESIEKVSLSTRQDDMFVVHVTSDCSSVLESPFKTEFLMTLHRRYRDLTKQTIRIEFADQIDFKLKKSGQKTIKFTKGQSSLMKVSSGGNGFVVSIADGLPAGSKPGQRERVDRSAVGSNIRVVSSTQSNSGRGGGRQQPNHQQQQQQHHAPHITHKQPPAHGGPTSRQNPPDGLYAEIQRGNTSKAKAASANNQTRAAPPALPPSRVTNKAAPGDVYGNANEFIAPARETATHGRQHQPPAIAAQSLRSVISQDRQSILSPDAKTCRALYDYDATDADELSFRTGDVIEVTKVDATGWWRGKLRGKRGTFPSNYVELVETPSISAGSSAGTKGKPQCRAMYAYQAQGNDQLSFKAGDIIEIVQEGDPNGWWTGQLNGRTGQIPGNYVQKI